MAFDEKKFVGADALSELSTKVKTELDKKTNKAGSLTNVSYDTTNKKFTKTTQGAHDPVTTDIVSTSTLKTDMGIADFDGTFNSLKSKPTTISGYGITDAKVQNSTVTIGSNSVTALTQDDVSSTYDSSGTSPVDGKAVAAALGTLDVESVGGAGKYISAISETDGKISATAETMDSTPTSNSTKAVTSDGIYEYVNSSVATNTAYFIGTFDSVEELEAYSGIITNNDYAFVTSTDSSGNTLYNRYKYNGSTHTWSFEYALNNSSFTSAQWATIQSGLTSSDKTKLDGIQSGANKTIVDAAMSSSSTNPVQNKVVNTALAGKQDTLTFDSTPTQSSTNPVTSAGIYTDQVRQDTLEAQDRAALIEVENKGAKNILKTYDIPETTIENVVFSIIDGVCSVSTTATQTTACVLVYAMDTDVGNASVNSRYTIPKGTYILKTTGNGKVKLRAIEHDGTNTNLLAETTGADVEFTYSGSMPYVVFTLSVSSNTSLSETVTFIPMCCLKAEYIIDQTAVKYGKTNAELTLLEKQDRDGLATAIDKGAKNLLKLGFTHKSAGSQTVDMTDDGNGIIVNGDRNKTTDMILVYDLVTNQSNMLNTRYTLPAGKYVMPPTGKNILRYQVYCHDGTNYQSLGYTMSVPLEFNYTPELKAQYPYLVYRLWVSRVSSFDNFIVYPMVCSKEEWDISQAYVPYGKTNAELTVLEQQDRDALMTTIDKGAKNIVDVNNMIYDTLEKDGVTLTRNGDTYTVTGIGGTSTNNFFNVYYIPNTILIPSGTWTFALIGTDLDDIRIEVYDDATGDTQKGTYGETSITFTIPSGVTLSYLRVCTKPGANFNTSNTAFKIMICKPSEYAISNAYVPYGITNPDLTTFTRAVANRGSKNVAEVTAVSSSAGGVDYTVNPDGTVIANRTSSSTTSTWFRLNPSLSLKAGTYILSGGKSANERLLVSPTATLADAIADSQGSEVTFTLTQDTDNLIYAIRIAYTDSPSNVKFYPMIRPVEILDSTYQPFAKTNADLTKEVDYAVNTGVKNLLNVKNSGDFPRTINGVTYNESNGVITTSDSATITTTLKMPITLDAGSYIISGCPANGSDSTYRIDMRLTGTNTVVGTNDYGNGFTLNVTTKTDYDCCIRFYQGASAANLTFKPMIRSASISDTSYQPYARSNPALTAEMDYVVNAGAKNVLPTTGITSEISGITFAVNADGTITSSGTLASGASSAVFECSNFQIRAGIYTYTCEGAAQQNVRDSYVQKYNGSSWDTVARDYENNTFTITQTEQLRVRLRVYSTGTSGTFKPMIRPAAITDATFQPFSKTNRELTVITDEDRDALVELVDSGAKNLLHFDKVGASGSYSTSLLTNGVRFTVNADGTITANRESSSSSNATVALVLNNTAVDVKNLCDGLHILSGCPSGGAVNTYRLYVAKGAYAVYDTGTGAVLSDTTENTVSVLIVVSKDYNIQNLIFRPMICTTTAWKISQAYQPYRPSWQEMYDRIVALENGNNRALTMQMQPTESTKPEENKELELTKTETEEVKEELKTKEPEVEDTEIKDDISSDLER